MKYYVKKDDFGNLSLDGLGKPLIFAFDADQLHLVTADMREISNQELAELLAPTPEQLVEQAKVEAFAYLSSTDWYVTRMSETGVAIPEDVLVKRAECRELL